MAGSNPGEVIGSVPDVIGAVLSLSEALRAGKGFVFNSCVLAIATGEETGDTAPTDPASAASRRGPASRPASAATPPRPTGIAERVGPTFLEVTSGAPGEGGGQLSVVRLALRQITATDQILGIVELQHLDEEFDEGGDSVAVELSVPEVAPEPRTALLAIKGFANPGGLGYAHFEAAILVSTGTSTPRLTTRALFASQAPPPQPGSGIFGKTVFVDALADRVRIHMERRPLFNR